MKKKKAERNTNLAGTSIQSAKKSLKLCKLLTGVGNT